MVKQCAVLHRVSLVQSTGWFQTDSHPRQRLSLKCYRYEVLLFQAQTKGGENIIKESTLTFNGAVTYVTIYIHAAIRVNR